MTGSRHRVLLIDDEPLARRRLRQLLAGAPDFDVVGECADAREAAAMARALHADVAFLDIRMPHLDGFAVLDALRRTVRHIVFVTAHPEHAARAFDVAASDYLVKPVTQARFDDALDRLRRAAGTNGVERILLGGRLGGAAVAIAEIVWLEAQGAYVTVHTGHATHVVRESLVRLLKRLGHTRFVRIHRSAAIGLDHVRRLRRRGNGLVVVLSDGTQLPISRRMAREVLGRLRGIALDCRLQQEATDHDLPD
jgi:two-component system LytT family response regulator